MIATCPVDHMSIAVLMQPQSHQFTRIHKLGRLMKVLHAERLLAAHQLAPVQQVTPSIAIAEVQINMIALAA